VGVYAVEPEQGEAATGLCVKGHIVDSDLLMKLLAFTLSALLALLLFQYRQLVTKIEKSETQLMSKLSEYSQQRQRVTDDVQETREQVIRMVERLESYIRMQDTLMVDFRSRFDKSDTLHMQILTRLGKVLVGRTPSPLDASRIAEID